MNVRECRTDLCVSIADTFEVVCFVEGGSPKHPMPVA
jgi:hypothetical protein